MLTGGGEEGAGGEVLAACGGGAALEEVALVADCTLRALGASREGGWERTREDGLGGGRWPGRDGGRGGEGRQAGGRASGQAGRQAGRRVDGTLLSALNALDLNHHMTF